MYVHSLQESSLLQHLTAKVFVQLSQNGPIEVEETETNINRDCKRRYYTSIVKYVVIKTITKSTKTCFPQTAVINENIDLLTQSPQKVKLHQVCSNKE